MKKNSILKTGYFANEKTFTKVHIVGENERPICGAQIGKDKKFQWNANSVVLDYIECDHCKKLVRS